MKLQSIVMPLTEFDHPEKGDALYGEFLLLYFVFIKLPNILDSLWSWTFLGHDWLHEIF